MNLHNSNLIEKIAGARSLDEIDSLAFDVCYWLDARAHALFELDYETSGEGKSAHNNISLISSRLNEQALSPLIHEQLNGLPGVQGEWRRFLAAHVWNTCLGKWVALASSPQSTVDLTKQNRLTTTLGLLIPVGQGLLRGFVLKDVQNRMLDKKITDFHRLGSALAARAAMLQIE